MDTSHEIRPLTALRFLAALLVFLSHFSEIPYARAAQPWQSIVIEGHAGVTIFFVLSGFLLTIRYFPSIADGTFSAYPYFLKRAARILPLYWILLGLTLLIDALTPYQTFTPDPIVNWTLTQSFFSQSNPPQGPIACRSGNCYRLWFRTRHNGIWPEVWHQTANPPASQSLRPQCMHRCVEQSHHGAMAETQGQPCLPPQCRLLSQQL